MNEDVTGSGEGQADTLGLGGAKPDSRSYIYRNAIRAICTGDQREVRKLTAANIYNMMCEQYGSSSDLIKSIDGIGKGVNQGEWIISFPNGKHPDALFKEGPDVVVKNSVGNVYLQDARKKFSEVKAARQPTKDLQFRISGLPIDVYKKELQVELNKLGFKVDLTQMRQMYDRTTKIRSEIVLFRVKVDSGKAEHELVEKSGQHTIELSGYTFKISVVCYGYCLTCKKSGHVSKDCDQRNRATCDLCKEIGHMKKSCPRREEILTQRRSKTTCFTCYRTGHYSSECDTEWIQPAQRTSEPMTNDGLEGSDRKHVTCGDSQPVCSEDDQTTVRPTEQPTVKMTEEDERNEQIANELRTAQTLVGGKRGRNNSSPPSATGHNGGKLLRHSTSENESLHTPNVHNDPNDTMDDADSETLDK